LELLGFGWLPPTPTEDLLQFRLPQAVRWCPKLRVRDAPDFWDHSMGNVESGMPLAEDGEGKPVLDENGEERRGVEAGRNETCVEKGSECKCMGCCFLKLGY